MNRRHFRSRTKNSTIRDGTTIVLSNGPYNLTFSTSVDLTSDQGGHAHSRGSSCSNINTVGKKIYPGMMCPAATRHWVCCAVTKTWWNWSRESRNRRIVEVKTFGSSIVVKNAIYLQVTVEFRCSLMELLFFFFFNPRSRGDDIAWQWVEPNAIWFLRK